MTLPSAGRAMRRALPLLGVALAAFPGPRAGVAQTPGEPAPAPTGSPEAPVRQGVPDRPGRAAWIRLGHSALLVGGLALFDQPGRDGARDLQGGLGDDLASFGHWYGDWQETALLLSGGIVLAGTAIDGGRGARRGLAVVAGVLTASLANEGLNRAIGRSRPDEELGAWSFSPFGDHASFASGHATYTFALASAIDAVSDDWWVSAPFYGAAVASALSRVYHDRHWLSDVGAGAIIGMWVGGAATRRAAAWMDAGAGRTEAGPLIEPIVGAGLVGGRIRF